MGSSFKGANLKSPKILDKKMSKLHSNDFLNMLDEEDINIGEDHDNVSQEFIDDAVIVGDQKIDQLIAYGKSGSIICKGIHKDSR